MRALAAAAAAACLATPAHAHGFGQRYDLPIPLSFYLVGTAAAVVVSFVIVGLFVREVSRAQPYPRLDLLATPPGRWIASPIARAGAQASRARRFHRHDHRRVPRRPESLQEHRAHHGVDHRLGRSRLCVGLRRRSLGGDQSLAHHLRIDRDHLPGDHRAARALAAAALSGGARRLARVSPAAGVLLDRAGLSQPGGAAVHRLARRRLFHSDLRRHVPVRPRALAASAARFSRWSSAPSRALRRSRSAPDPAAACGCGRTAPGCSRAARFRPR